MSERDSWKNFTFEQFQRRAAPGGDVGHFVFSAPLGATRRSVSSTFMKKELHYFFEETTSFGRWAFDEMGKNIELATLLPLPTPLFISICSVQLFTSAGVPVLYEYLDLIKTN